MSPRTLVVGGGLAGLLAARRHQRAGHQVVLLEGAAEVGGAIAAVELAGVDVSSGAEAYSRGSGAVDALVTGWHGQGPAHLPGLRVARTDGVLRPL